jgi:hypothetical protein
MGRAVRGGATMALTKKSKFKYWVGELIDGHEIIDDRPRDKDNCRIGPAPPPIYPQPKMGNSMPVSDKNCYGILTNDIKVVEWYVAERKAHGVAVYFEEERKDDDEDGDGEYYSFGRKDEDGKVTPVFHDDYDGRFIGFLYDRADYATAIEELAYRDKYHTKPRLAAIKANDERDALEAAEIKARCEASGCKGRLDKPCKHTRKFGPFANLCPEDARYREDRRAKKLAADIEDLM